MTLALALALAMSIQAPAAQQAPAPAAAEAVARFAAAVDGAAKLLDTDVTAAVDALDHLAIESIDMRRVRPLTDAERATHRQLFQLRANGHMQLLNNDKVEESLRELLRVDPFFSGQLAPREQSIVDALRSKEGGVLEITSPEPGSTVFVNGAPAGVTGDAPTRTSVIAGEYEVRLEKEGFQAGVTRIVVLPGQTAALRDLAPKRRIPPIAFLANRGDLEVVVDNAAPARMTALISLRSQLTAAESTALDQMAGGANLDPQSTAGFLLRDPALDRPILFRFRRDCFVEESRMVTVTSDMLAKAGTDPLLWLGDMSLVRPQPDVGTLRVLSTPRDADVFVDGQLVGRTPFERSVCSGQHRVRLRHRIGSYNATAAVIRGRTEVVDTVLKPGIAVIGAVDATQTPAKFSPDLAAQIERTLTASVSTFRAAARLDLPPELPRWTDASTVELVTAIDRNDPQAIARLLKLANDNFEAPLMVAAVRRSGAASPDRGAGAPAAGIDVLVLWSEHAGVDRAAWTGQANDLDTIVARIDSPADGTDLVYQNDLGVRVADIALGDAPLLVVRVDPGSPGVAAGVRAGDTIESVDGAPMNAQKFGDVVRQKRPGDIVTLRVGGNGPARQVPLPVQRKPRRAPVFDPDYYGNALIAKLTAASIIAPNSSERDLLTFSLAVAYMRFGDYKTAADLLAPLNALAEGPGVGRGAALYFRGRCLEALGDRDAA
ncbi:MAG TPA: PEGA domain-containing protein, partial [Vicinamibacterales bacterium]|nr:PEGA domain-containing protein [Vicinamibacterales bacterium]